MSPPTKYRETPDRRAEFALCIVVLIWGLNIPTVKYALGFVDALFFNALRLIISAVCLGIVDRIEARRESNRPEIPWFAVVRIGLVGSLFYQVAFIKGIHYTTAGNTALLLASIPVWTGIVAFLMNEERLAWREWCGLICAFLGTSVVTFDGSANFSQSHMRGNLLILTASILWAVGTILTRRAMTGISPNRLAFLMTIVMLPFHLAIGLPGTSAADLEATGVLFWAAVFFSGALSTGLGYSLWNFGVKRIGSSHAAVFQNMAPVIALTASWLMLAEPIRSSQILGGVMILGGLFVMRASRRNSARSPIPATKPTA